MSDADKLERLLMADLERLKDEYEAKAAPIIAKLTELKNLSPMGSVYVSLIDGKLSN